MEINELIMESIKTTIMEGKKDQTSVQFGGEKGPSLKDKNVESKNQAAVDGGLKGDIADENKNPQGEGGKEALQPIQKNPKLIAAVTAGIINIGAKIKPNPNIKFTPPAPADK